MYWPQSLRSLTSSIENFQRFAGSSSRASRRRRCSCREMAQMEFQHQCAVEREMALESADAVESLRLQIALVTSCAGRFCCPNNSRRTRTTSTSS
jgi:hypothetical protein